MTQKRVMEWQWCQCVGFDVTVMLAQRKCLAETARGGKNLFLFAISEGFQSTPEAGKSGSVSGGGSVRQWLFTFSQTRKQSEKVGNQGPGYKGQRPIPTDLILLAQLHLHKNP